MMIDFDWDENLLRLRRVVQEDGLTIKEREERERQVQIYLARIYQAINWPLHYPSLRFPFDPVIGGGKLSVKLRGQALLIHWGFWGSFEWESIAEELVLWSFVGNCIWTCFNEIDQYRGGKPLDAHAFDVLCRYFRFCQAEIQARFGEFFEYQTRAFLIWANHCFEVFGHDDREWAVHELYCIQAGEEAKDLAYRTARESN